MAGSRRERTVNKLIKYWRVQLFAEAKEGVPPLMVGYQKTCGLDISVSGFLTLSDETGTVIQGVRLDQFAAFRVEPIYEE